MRLHTENAVCGLLSSFLQIWSPKFSDFSQAAFCVFRYESAIDHFTLEKSVKFFSCKSEGFFYYLLTFLTSRNCGKQLKIIIIGWYFDFVHAEGVTQHSPVFVFSRTLGLKRQTADEPCKGSTNWSWNHAVVVYETLSGFDLICSLNRGYGHRRTLGYVV